MIFTFLSLTLQLASAELRNLTNHTIQTVMLSKRYQFINNIGGWFVFAIALVTYWLTLEPTASYWDCGEFIIQADKLEVGHPPGNPIFMLTARFFANFASGPQTVSLMVNAMSGLLSALTILLLFWTITHLVRRLVVKDGQTGEPSLQQYLAIMGSGLAGALAYCWSDTFWFSAVEGEVYAFSSFCTALVFWLILKWENRADDPHSDRYLILIAYIIGVSVAVHLLNLLCIPAIVLVYAYRRFQGMNLMKSLLALGVSFVIVFFVLYGLVPGFIKVAQRFELFFVNSCGMSYNSGALIYVLVMALAFCWSIAEIWRQRSAGMIRISFLLATALTGVAFIGKGVWVGLVLLVALAAWLWIRVGRPLPLRVMNVVMWSMAVIFVGYSSYALILIRSTADTPMNQNSPDNVFDLASYLNREQYGSAPLLYGETLNSSPMKELVGLRTDTVDYVQGIPVTITTPSYRTIIKPGAAQYAKGVKGVQPESEMNFLSEGEKAYNATLERTRRDYYVKSDYAPEPRLNPELDMLFPRIYDRAHTQMYASWVNLDTMPDQMKVITARDAVSGESLPELDLYGEPVFNEQTMSYTYPVKTAFRPSFSQNLGYFLNYQLGHMYLRYFMWNFAGRQNDILNQDGELDAGNWISGIPLIDNPRLGDQSLLPDDLGKNNKGHNVYYMLPLILGVIGLLWQSFAGRRGIEQFWVVFFLFFMTGIAIVLYLNQFPGQPRERDYAFAGSFYAYAIWIGMGVAGLWRVSLKLAARGRGGKDVPAGEEPEQSPAMTEEPAALWKHSRYCAAAACLVGLAIPLQMVSQTWDDHDRSGRYAARDYAVNYLESLEPDAIVFCNGDNDTFPLWYVQEVEGVRPDVRIINLSYLNSDWYANQMLMQSYDSAPVEFTATPRDYAYGRSDVTILGRENAPADLLSSLKLVYSGAGRAENGYPTMPSGVVTIPVDRRKVIERGLVAPGDTALIENEIVIDLRNTSGYRSRGYLSLGEILMLDIIATNAAQGWPRPIYWASTVGSESHVGLTPYLRSTGMTHQLVPTVQEGMATRADRAFDVVTRKYRWGGADAEAGKEPYFDETARRMLITMRSSMVDLATELVYQGDRIAQSDPSAARADYQKALKVIDLLEKNLPARTSPYSLSIGLTLGELQCELGDKSRLGDSRLTQRGLASIWSMMERYAPYLRYNSDVSMRFGNNIALTPESRMLPYQFWRFIELYEQYGGKRGKVDALLARYGADAGRLKENYDALYNRKDINTVAAGEKADESTLKEYTEDLIHYCEIANELSGLTPEAYAARSEEEKMYDSILSQAISYYIAVGGSEEELRKYGQYQKLDRSRSERLGKEYEARHAR